MAYSRSKGVWAYPDSIFGGLIFTGATGAGRLQWEESYSVSPSQVTLTINNLRLPQKVIWVDDPNCWADIDVGYYVELKNAVFEDHTIAKAVFISKTFAGDTPPKKVEKQFSIQRVKASDSCSQTVEGEWFGSYVMEGRTCDFVMRLTQSGNAVTGAGIDFDPKQKARCSIEGWIVDGRLTFLKRYTGNRFGLSYVSSPIGPTHELSGRWSAAFNKQGEWNASWKGKFQGSVDELPISMPK
jgi:hypothetical protein